MPPEPDAARMVAEAPRAGRPALRLLTGGREDRPLRIVDVAMFYGERSGGIRTYLDAKAAFTRDCADIDHHLVTPGLTERHDDGRHELPGLRLATANGYRIPRGAAALKRTLRLLAPDVVLLHDPFWAPHGVAEVAHEVGALVIAVHHGSSELDAAGLPGPSGLYEPLLRAWLRHASEPVDAIMSVVDTRRDCGRAADLPLRLGLDPEFLPRSGVPRGDHTVYVGRLAREKGVFELLEAASLARDPWPLRFIGSGPVQAQLAERARRLGLAQRVSFRPFIGDRGALARAYAQARCVVMPGTHETFGLAAFEAVASGARTVCAQSAPSGRLCGDLVHTFAPGDVRGLERAIALARAAEPQPAASAALAWRYAWPRVFRAEIASLRELVERARA